MEGGVEASSGLSVSHETIYQAIHALALGAGDDPRPRAGTKREGKARRQIGRGDDHARPEIFPCDKPTDEI
jgi:hypothetical protein